MSKKKLSCKSLSIHTTSACTLRCEKCGWSFPYYTNKIETDIDKTLSVMGKIFDIYDEVIEVRFGGAEAFLYPHIIELMNGLSTYSDRFEYGIVVTNGTYVPKNEIIDGIKQLPYPFVVRVDNYGVLSKKYNDIVNLLKENNIKVDERQYNDNEQAYGGWIDLGDYKKKNYSEREVRDIFYNCRVPDDCTIVIDDCITICSYAFSGKLLGWLPEGGEEFINLSENATIDDFRKRIVAWRSKPLKACSYCNGCDPMRSPRIIAAKQIDKGRIER